MIKKITKNYRIWISRDHSGLLACLSKIVSIEKISIYWSYLNHYKHGMEHIYLLDNCFEQWRGRRDNRTYVFIIFFELNNMRPTFKNQIYFYRFKIHFIKSLKITKFQNKSVLWIDLLNFVNYSTILKIKLNILFSISLLE